MPELLRDQLAQIPTQKALTADFQGFEIPEEIGLLGDRLLIFNPVNFTRFPSPQAMKQLGASLKSFLVRGPSLTEKRLPDLSAFTALEYWFIADADLSDSRVVDFALPNPALLKALVFERCVFDARTQPVQLGSGWLPWFSSLESLRLADLGLSGQLPLQDLHSLEFLRELDVSRNNLSGPLPEFGAPSSSVTLLNFSYNDFSPPLPGAWAEMDSLNLVDLVANPKLNNTSFPPNYAQATINKIRIGPPL
jgi:hypothetical protein